MTVVCQMLMRWTNNSPHSINVWYIVSKVVLLSLVYQAPQWALLQFSSKSFSKDDPYGYIIYSFESNDHNGFGIDKLFTDLHILKLKILPQSINYLTHKCYYDVQYMYTKRQCIAYFHQASIVFAKTCLSKHIIYSLPGLHGEQCRPGTE